MTTTTTTPVSQSELFLVTYTGREGFPVGDYFAIGTPSFGRDWVTLIVAEHDSRRNERRGGGTGMWVVSDVERSRYALPDDGVTYYGWHIPPTDYTVVPVPEESTPETVTPRAVSSARDLRKGDAFRIQYDTETQYVVTGDLNDNGTLPIVWQTNGRDRDLDWAGPSVTVSVSLIPESEQNEFTRAKVREVTGDSTPEESTPEVCPDDVAPESPEETVTLTAAELAERLESARLAGKREADAVFEAWKESANRTAVEYADANSLCSEFDRCMRDIGLMDRDEWREHNATEFTVEYTYTTTVMAYDSDEAIERASEEFDGESWRGDWAVI